MVKIKRLADITDSFLNIVPPITDRELEDRNNDYPSLTPSRFALKSNSQVYRPTKFKWKELSKEIQVNHCANPFCKNYGLPQKRFKIMSKPHRYKIIGKGRSKRIHCNPDREKPDDIPTLNCSSRTMSNWSLAEEIGRLIRINSVIPIQPNYKFHRDNCLKVNNPFNDPKGFYKRGIFLLIHKNINVRNARRLLAYYLIKKRTQLTIKNDTILFHSSLKCSSIVYQ